MRFFICIVNWNLKFRNEQTTYYCLKSKETWKVLLSRSLTVFLTNSNILVPTSSCAVGFDILLDREMKVMASCHRSMITDIRIFSRNFAVYGWQIWLKNIAERTWNNWRMKYILTFSNTKRKFETKLLDKDVVSISRRSSKFRLLCKKYPVDRI